MSEVVILITCFLTKQYNTLFIFRLGSRAAFLNVFLYWNLCLMSNFILWYPYSYTLFWHLVLLIKIKIIQGNNSIYFIPQIFSKFTKQSGLLNCNIDEMMVLFLIITDILTDIRHYKWELSFRPHVRFGFKFFAVPICL